MHTIYLKLLSGLLIAAGFMSGCTTSDDYDKQHNKNIEKAEKKEQRQENREERREARQQDQEDTLQEY